MSPEQEAAVVEVLDGASDMTVATVRPDGYPQATMVSFVHDGLRLYFSCGKESQKAHNIRENPAVSVTVTLPYGNLAEIRGLSLGGRAAVVDDPTELERVGAAMKRKFPQVGELMEQAQEEFVVMRVDPEVISLLDYRKGFGHTEELRG